MPYAEVNEARIFYEQHGAGPDLVLLHGAGGNHLSWWQQIPVYMGISTAREPVTLHQPEPQPADSADGYGELAGALAAEPAKMSAD